MPILKTEKLTHTYSAKTPFEHTAIRDVDFSAEKGECIGIIGRTGSGKSTFVQHLNGLLAPTSGRVYFDGQDVSQSKEFMRGLRFKVGLVFQYPEHQLFEETVYDDIAFGPKNMGLSEKEVWERVEEAAGFVSLGGDVLKKNPFELSGGQKRRAAIAGVIAMRPEVLILDEPTAGLDPKGRDEIMRNIGSYKNSRNAAIIMVTHDMEGIAQAARRIIVFEGGRLVMDDIPGRVFSSSGRLAGMGLAVPKAAMIAERLRGMGVPLGGGIYTFDGLRRALNERRGGDACHD